MEVLRVGAVGIPYRVALTPAELVGGLDLSTVIAATIWVKSKSGIITSWSGMTPSNQTPTTLSLTRVLLATDFTEVGRHHFYADLALSAGPNRLSEPWSRMVYDRFTLVVDE